MAKKLQIYTLEDNFKATYSNYEWPIADVLNYIRDESVIGSVYNTMQEMYTDLSSKMTVYGQPAFPPQTHDGQTTTGVWETYSTDQTLGYVIDLFDSGQQRQTIIDSSFNKEGTSEYITGLPSTNPFPNTQFIFFPIGGVRLSSDDSSFNQKFLYNFATGLAEEGSGKGYAWAAPVATVLYYDDTDYPSGPLGSPTTIKTDPPIDENNPLDPGTCATIIVEVDPSREGEVIQFSTTIGTLSSTTAIVDSQGIASVQLCVDDEDEGDEGVVEGGGEQIPIPVANIPLKVSQSVWSGVGDVGPNIVLPTSFITEDGNLLVIESGANMGAEDGS